MPSIDGLKRKIENAEGIMNISSDEKDYGVLDYGEYVRAVKWVLKQVEAGKDLKNILESAKYSAKLKKILRGIIPKLIKKLEEENLWECEK